MAMVFLHSTRALLSLDYRLGRRAAEDNLRDGPLLASGPELISERVQRLLSSPGTASGDLRKSQQLAKAELEATGSVAQHSQEVDALLCSAYDFSQTVLAKRWSQVQALSGALLARGTLDGGQLAALIKCQEAATHAEDWMHLVSSCPLLFGCIWATVACPQATYDRTAPPLAEKRVL